MKLASVERIINLQSIPNNDSEEIATILGWSCKVQKDIFDVNDLCIFLRKGAIYKSKHIEASQGCALCMETFSESEKLQLTSLAEGSDVGSFLHVRKREADLQVGQQRASGTIPHQPFAPDIFFLQVPEVYLRDTPELLQEIRDQCVSIHERLDQSLSITLVYRKSRFTLCSRHTTVYDVDMSSGTIFTDTSSQMLRSALSKNLPQRCSTQFVAVQGDFVNDDIFVHSVFDLRSRRMFSFDETKEFCITNDFTMTRSLYVGPFHDSWGVQYFQDLANVSSVDIVVRPTQSFKSIHSQNWYHFKIDKDQ